MIIRFAAVLEQGDAARAPAEVSINHWRGWLKPRITQGLIRATVLASVARGKMRMSWDETHALVGAVRGLLAVHPVTLETHEVGLRIAERHGFPVYDAMIVVSAMEVGCDILWSEDMRGGVVVVAGLRIVNPFA